MLRYILTRAALIVPTLLAAYTLTFLLMHATPGGPWAKEKPLPAEVIANLNRKYHLDDPLWKQYVDYVGRAVFHGDLGPSYKNTARDVSSIIAEQFPVSLQLGLVAMALGTVVGVGLGIVSALRQNTWLDYAASFFAIAGVSVPSFVVGPILVLIFALALGWLPTGGWGEPKHLVLPAVALALYPAAVLARYTRAAMLEVLRTDYLRTARAKGLASRVVILRHGLRNALIPVITVAGVLAAVVVTGSFFVETIFRVPGIGRYFITAVSNRDYPVLMGVTLLFAVAIALANLLIDLAYGYLDPRIRYND